MRIQDGGPAFANCAVSPDIDTWWNEGMSLRDYFAGQVISGLVVDNSEAWANAMTETAKRTGIPVIDQYARTAYLYADALLKERERDEDDG